MKFKKPDNYTEWSDEKTKKQIVVVDGDIADFNKQLNKLNSRITVLQEKKKEIRGKISNKNRYRNQLIKQHTDNLSSHDRL